jgi:hypothetical protein
VFTLIFGKLYAHLVSDPHCVFLLLEATTYGLMVLLVCFRHTWIWIGYMIMMTLLFANAALDTGLIVNWLG